MDDEKMQQNAVSEQEGEAVGQPVESGEQRGRTEQEGQAESGSPEDDSRLFLEAVESLEAPEQARRGELVEGRIVSMGSDFAVIDLGGKSEGFLSIEELKDSDGKLPQVGETVEAYVISEGSDGIVLSRRVAKSIRNRQFIQQAYESRIPVEGRVTGRNKGGFDVEVAGMRAFCPISQIELGYCENPDVHLNERYNFIITKLELEGRRPDIVLSRKEFLKAEAERRAKELRESLKEGDVVDGVVKSVHPFGAFVDLGGLDGFLPASEVSYDRGADPRDILQTGEQIHAEVLSFDRQADKITLSLRRLEADPWQDVAQRYPPGSRHKGEVTRIKNFGAFVKLEPGIEGLVHISNLNTPERVTSPAQVLKEGQEITVEVLEIDQEQRRIALARVPQEGEFGEIPVVGATVEGIVDGIANFGVFVRLGPGRKGLVPNSELGIDRGADPRRFFKPGDTVKVKVLDVQENGKRIRLSRKAVLEEQERGQVEGYLAQAGQDQQVSLGTLGDILRKKLGK